MIMRNCCCCRVTRGSVVLGLMTLISAVIVLIPLVGYWFDTPYLNVIKNQQRTIEFNIEDSLKRHEWTKEDAKEIMRIIKDNFQIAIMVATAYTGVTILASLLLIVSVCSNVRCLMIPFLILSMLDIVLCGTLGIVVVVALFYVNTIHGAVASVVYVLAAVVSLYCWATILSAYKYLGTPAHQQGYIYSPVTPSREMPAYYPSAPQYFPMGDFSETTPRQ